MSSASKLKDNNKSFTKVSKEHQKVPSKSSASSSTGGIPANGYNPLQGTFHSLETSSANSSPPKENARFQNLDKTHENPGSSSKTSVEYDSVSNNGSCSGESEDHKDKTSSVQKEAIPGSDNDKREKIRQKNEKKHQRQREKRAQELHEKCIGYLMSRKLEALTDQLVAMGFSSERATMALIINEGRVEPSVTWLFEAGEEATELNDFNSGDGGNLKLDIAEEQRRMAAFAARYKCSMQEIERVVVACEGDLDRTANTLSASKKEADAPLPAQTGHPSVVNDGKPAETIKQNQVTQSKVTASVTPQREDERNLTYPKPKYRTGTIQEYVPKKMQPPTITQPKSELARPMGASPMAEKSRSNVGSSSSVPYSLASPLQVAPPPPMSNVRYVAVGGEALNSQTETSKQNRQPVIIQGPQSINSNQNSSLDPRVSVSSRGTSNKYPDPIVGTAKMFPDNSMRGTVPTYLDSNAGATKSYPYNIRSTEALNLNSTVNVIPSSSSTSHQIYNHQPSYQPVSSSSVDYYSRAAAGSKDDGSWRSLTGTLQSPSHLVDPSPVGVYLGSKGPGPSSFTTFEANWVAGPGLIPPSDYSHIDWTVGKIIYPKQPNEHHSSSFVSGDRGYDMQWSGTSIDHPRPMARSAKPNVSSSVGGDDIPEKKMTSSLSSSSETAPTVASSSSSEEWTSPFGGRDLFSITRQIVTSPSL